MVQLVGVILAKEFRLTPYLFLFLQLLLQNVFGNIANYECYYDCENDFDRKSYPRQILALLLLNTIQGPLVLRLHSRIERAPNKAE